MPPLRPHLLAGSRPARELAEAFGGDRVALKRAYDREADQLLRLGSARTTRYAARRTLPGLTTDEFPVFRVDDIGRIATAGHLITLEADESVWLPDETVIDGLPPEIQDVAPRGFLGRSFSRWHADLDLPEDLRNWSDHHVLAALTRRGEDLPGNLVIGRESFDRFHRQRHDECSEGDFPDRARAALAGEHVGSSAGGEQPKFTALVEGRHRIVKFASSASDNARRWRDLLALEHLALRTLADAGIEAAETRLIDVVDWRFLIVTRFDRVGETGRKAVVTLGAASGRADSSWTDAAEEMKQRGELDAAHVQRIALLDAFGAQIANTDRHLFNLVLFPGPGGYSVAPTFDQLPMAYAPPASGNLRTAAAEEPVPTVNTLDAWGGATELAREFWSRAAGERLTDSMREIVRNHLARIDRRDR